MPLDPEFDVSRLVAAIRHDIPLSSLRLPDEYFYASLPLCVIDAVYSIGVTYQTTSKTVQRWCTAQGWPRLRGDGVHEHTIDDFLTLASQSTPDDLAKGVFENRQRTSSKSGILKAEAAVLFARALAAAGIQRLGDMNDPAKNELAAQSVRAIPGQGSGISWDYFLMLAGSDDHVKADRMVCRYVGAALGEPGPASVSRARSLLIAAAKALRDEGAQVTPRSVDYAVWQLQRDR